jgi:predicted acyltransferase
MQRPPRPRLAALDSFRGLTVAGMIIVNTPGSGEHVWWPLDHAEWHGFTPTDLVFPAFLCAMGLALGLSFPRAISNLLWRRIAWRVFGLIAIGWAWQMLARPSIEMFRVFGVLPRLGLCFGLAASFAILTAHRPPEGKARLNPAAILIAIIVLLLGYWAAMALGGDFTPEGNLAGQVDRAIVGAEHMWRLGTDNAGNVVYDPEGLFSTLPATANVLFGLLAALAWQRAHDRSTLWRATSWTALAGLALALLGLALAPYFPINKRIWTSSFVLLSTGLSALLFAGCIVATRSAAVRRLLLPFDLLGMNAILAYVVSLLIGLAGMRLGFQAAGFAAVDGLLHAPYLSSFLYALAVLLVVLALLIPLHRRGIHLRL